MSTSRDEVVFSSDVYNLDVIKRAAYRFTGVLAFNFSLRDKEIVCAVTLLSDDKGVELQRLVEEFKNEVLDQDLRKKIGDETAGVRNLILAHVFSKTGLQSE